MIAYCLYFKCNRCSWNFKVECFVRHRVNEWTTRNHLFFPVRATHRVSKSGKEYYAHSKWISQWEILRGAYWCWTLEECYFKIPQGHVWDKIKWWLETLLSISGKDVLIKPIAQAIHVYSTTCFRLPRGLCEHINSLICEFWWGSKQGKRKASWVSWEVMTRPKYLRAFQDQELFNLFLLARQSWRIEWVHLSLSARILQASNFPDTTTFESKLGSHPSQIWQSILDGRILWLRVLFAYWWWQINQHLEPKFDS